jgi:hypothetical protein
MAAVGEDEFANNVLEPQCEQNFIEKTMLSIL